MTFAAFDALGPIVANRSAMGVGFHSLAVQNGSRWVALFTHRVTNVGTEPIVERRPCMVKSPLSKDVIDGLPGRKVGREQSPLDAAFADIQDRVDNASPISARPSAFAWFGEHG